MASLNHRGSSLLGYRNAYHLLCRASYNITKERIDQFAALTVDQALDILFDFNAFDFNEFSDKEPYQYDTDQPIINYGAQLVGANDPELGKKINSVDSWFLSEAARATTIRFKLTFFLHSIFVTTRSILYLVDYDYLKLEFFFAKGSIKDFARKAAEANAMHVFLNNNVNVVGSPNENFAREFLELFTITKSTQAGTNDYTTYTEHDVQQAARVMTGFTNRDQRDVFDTDTNIPTGIRILANHDTGNKTFSHRFGNQTITGATTVADMPRELDDFVIMVFNQEYTAVAYARRLFRFFVHGQISDEVEADIIQPLAAYLKANNYNLELAVRKLLASQHFYDEDDSFSGNENIGGLIKTPLDLFLHTTNLFRIKFDANESVRNNYYNYYFFMGQRFFMKNCDLFLFRSTTVAGYVPIYQEPDYDKQWISVNTLANRYNLGISLIDGRDRVSGTNRLIRGQFDAFEFLENSGYFTDILNNLYANPPVNAGTEMPKLLDRIFEIAFGSKEKIGLERTQIIYETHLLGALSDINWAFEWKNYKDGVTTGDDIKSSIESVFREILESIEYQIF